MRVSYSGSIRHCQCLGGSSILLTRSIFIVIKIERGSSANEIGEAARSTSMYKVYILQSLKDQRTYVGYTDNLERRLVEHNAGQNKSTKHRVPFELLFSEEFENSKDAKSRELYWKSGGGRRKLKELFKSKGNQNPIA